MSFEFCSRPLIPGIFEPEGLYLHPPFRGTYPIGQPFGRNATFFGRFSYDGVPLRGHDGVDFTTPVGTPVLAVAGGDVLSIGYDAARLGLFLRLRHLWGESLYANLGNVQVAAGQTVVRGALLGVSDRSGIGRAPHLHLGIRIEPIRFTDGWGGYCDPLPYLDPAIVTAPNAVASGQSRKGRPQTPAAPLRA